MTEKTTELPAPSADWIPARLTGIWERAYRARSNADLIDLYADWSAHYDRDHEAVGYVGHRIAAAFFSELIPKPAEARILDAGAGTGAAGSELRKRGFRRLTALDLSAEMLQKARQRDIYEDLLIGDLGAPIDTLAADTFDGALLVGVFSYGQAPAHSLDEVVRLVRPGGLFAFTARDDFFDADEMGVRSRIDELEKAGAIRHRETSSPHRYLPRKDPNILFRVRCYEVLDSKRVQPSDRFVEDVREALSEPGPVKHIDHSHIWDATASRLYDDYIKEPDYYLTECEEEIVVRNAADLASQHDLFVELGCGSARKISPILEAATRIRRSDVVEYVPIDLSVGALRQTAQTVTERFEDRVQVRPLRGHFEDMLSRIPDARAKSLFFFGSSIGNIESTEATVAFLASIRQRMTPRDRLIVGFDMVKDEKVLLDAYNAGRANRSFFVHMVRRINGLLGADFNVKDFELASTAEEDPEWRGLRTRRVDLKVRTLTEQDVRVERLGMDVHLNPGDALRVGISRKFRTDDIRILAKHAGLQLRTLWFDARQYFVLAEFLSKDAPPEAT